MAPGPLKRARNTLIVTFLAYALLVATNLGEFWPFSIFPMFSQGGIPWSRAVVRDVSDDPESVRWGRITAAELPGDAYPLLEHGVNPIDLANFVSKTRSWHEERVDGLRRMFGEDELARRRVLVVRADGELIGDSVAVTFVPYALMLSDTTLLHPDLPRSPSE